jgi:cobalamin biosynthesis protein CobT
MRRLIFFVEGDGELDAVPTLVKRLVGGQSNERDILLDENPFRVGSVHRLVKDNFREWKRLLGAALKRRNVGGVLLILDGDVEKVGGKTFCAAEVAKSIAATARQVGAGKTFSVAAVFGRQEYETWLIAGIASLAGKRLIDGRLINSSAKAPEADLEAGPRNAKGWLDEIVEGGYRPTRDQAALTKLVDLDMIRSRKLRSFRRLESAITTLLHAIRSDTHVVSPS